MQSFFSGTDIATLKEEGRDRNHFVSLIVNNAGSYTAAITRKIKYVENRKFSYSTFEGKEIVDVEEIFDEVEELEYFYLEIVFEDKVKYSFQDVSTRLEEIKKSKEKKRGSSPFSSGTSSLNNSTVKEPTLFDKALDDEDWETEMDIKAYNASYGITEEPDIPYKTRCKVTEKLINDLTCQLITGSVTMSYHDKFDYVKWIKTTMLGLFNKRFGNGLTGISNCREWAIDFIEYICNCSINTEDHDENEIAYLIANGIIKKFMSLPKNDYIEMFIDLLQTYAEFI